MAGFAEIVSYLSGVDSSLTLAINSLHCPASDFVWKTFSQVSVWIPLYLAVALFIFRRLGWKRGLVSLCTLILTVVACDQIANLVKDSVCRLRPCHDEYMIQNGLRLLEKAGGKYGFYSGHAANAMGFAVATSKLFRIDKKHRYSMYTVLISLWALLLGASRIFVGKHFFGDVLTGFAAGSLTAWITASVAVWCCGKFIRQ